jgi:threonine dehydratase
MDYLDSVHSLPFEITRDSLEDTHRLLGDYVTRTPVVSIPKQRLMDRGPSTLLIKLETLQETGSFKFRGAVNNLLSLDPQQRRRGVITVSSGNHGIALAEAGRRFCVPVTVVVGRNANSYRREQMAERGAVVEVADNVQHAFELAKTCAVRDGLKMVHPYDGVATIAATASLGFEFHEQIRAIEGCVDALVLPVGGGGMAAGVATAFKLLSPNTKIFAVEPAGAPTFSLALKKGRPVWLETMDSIADSLGAPIFGEDAFVACSKSIDEVVLVEDSEIRTAMRYIFDQFHQYVEPSAAATMAAILGALRPKLLDKKVAVLFCGANVAPSVFASYLS